MLYFLGNIDKMLDILIKDSDNVMIFGDDYWCLKVFKQNKYLRKDN